MIRISNISMDLNFTIDDIKHKISKKFHINEKDIISIKLSKKSIDARKKPNICFVCSVDIELRNSAKYKKTNDIKEIIKFDYNIPKISENLQTNPVIIGTGPSGLFCGLILARAGLNPIIIEQGNDVKSRKKDVSNFWNNGILNISSNVQFGEGGAGTFSDGKLTTNINDSRISFVLDEFYKAGAPEEITYLSKPHIGTDFLVDVIENIRKEIISLGGKIYFGLKFTGIKCENNSVKAIEVTRITDNSSHSELGITVDTPSSIIKAENVVLAIGHSARDTFELLHKNGINITPKPFSVGFRIEHLQKMINKSQYGDLEAHNAIGSAEYKLSCKTSNNRGVYTFCMCPGGQVVASSSEENSVVTNGMSYFSRNGDNANSGLLVSIFPEDFANNEGIINPLDGISFQRNLEKKAFAMGGNNYFAPVQMVGDYLKNIKSNNQGNVEPTYKPGVNWTNLNELLPENLNSSLHEALQIMNRKINGFSSYDGVLTGIETRSSSPIKIERNDDGYCNIKGLLPCGEGCGYAGGIMSASVDGVKCAEKILQKFS